MSHEDGCAKLSTSGINAFFVKFPWAISVIFILTGPIVALKGKPLFRWIVTGLAGFLAFIIMLAIF